MIAAKTTNSEVQPERKQLSGGLKGIARRIASKRIIGIPATYVLRGMGAARLARRVSDLCGYVPDIVPIAIENENRPQKFRMHRGPQGQMDQGSAIVWLRGWKGFEPPLPEMFAACARDAQVVFDIGANAGFYSLVATTVSGLSRIHAFEPFPLAQERMEANLRLNGVLERVRICRKALSNESGVAKLFVPAKAHTLLETSCSLNADFRAEHSQVLEVPVITLDEYVRQEHVQRVDLIKLDVESQEHRVLEGAQETLRTLRPITFLEVLKAANHAALEAVRQRLEYRSIQMKPNQLAVMGSVEFNEQAKNQILCPAEKVDEVARKARELGINFLQPGAAAEAGGKA
jgi:FkbM family methyltransferase